MEYRTEAIFIADTHLGARYLPDEREHERRLVRFLESEVLEAGVPRLYMLGDMIDFWWEYKSVVPRGFTRFFGALGRLADAGVELTWIKGNHDIWMDGYLAYELGVRIVDEVLTAEIAGKRIFMAHGDGCGRQPRGYRLLRSLFRNDAARKVYSALHPRLGLGIAHRWAAHSRKVGAGVDTTPAVNALEQFCREMAQADDAPDYFIFGHLHTAVDRPIGDGRRMIVLDDWVDGPSYAALTADGSIALR